MTVLLLICIVTVVFLLQHIRFMEMPEETDYVSHWKATEEHENKERREMMRLTLDMSQRQEREEYEGRIIKITTTLILTLT